MDPLNYAYDAYTLLAILCFTISGCCLVKAILIVKQNTTYFYRRRIRKLRYGIASGKMSYQFHFGLHSLYVYFFLPFNIRKMVDNQGKVTITK